jgi:hypothetical protein
VIGSPLLLLVFLLAVLLVALVAFALLFGAGARAKPGRFGSGKFLDRALVAERWAAVERNASSGGLGLRQAIGDADKLLDYVLKSLGMPGETLADRLRRVESRLSDRNGVWRAHKLRNSLAHELEFDLLPSSAREALADFHRALKDLGAL